MTRIEIADLLTTDTDDSLELLSEDETKIHGGMPMVVIGIAIACALLLAHD